jgi:hypothetical protein
MTLRKEQAEQASEEYQEWLNVQCICDDCGEVFFPHQDNHYIYVICSGCLDDAPFMPYEGDHASGKVDRRASLRADGQEGNDYFG